jgi:ABC-2 type transport system permease protein
MSNTTQERIRDSLNIIWTIASKDVVDALKNRLVVSLVLLLSIMLLLPKMLPFIFEQPGIVLPIYDAGDSRLVAELQKDPALTVQEVGSEQEFALALCGALYPEIGLRIPPEFDQVIETAGQIELQGYVCWSKRYQASSLSPKLEAQLSQSLGRGVTIHAAGNMVYPGSDGMLSVGMATMNAVIMILTMGIQLVPNLLFEEKQTKTMQALLVSPASIGQVVAAKALAGAFYILVTAVMVFAFLWADVTHWGLVILFVIGGGVLSVAVGLVLGSFYDRQQDMVGPMMVLIVLLLGGLVAGLPGVDLPALVERVLPWVPSVALAEMCRAAFLESVPATRVLTNLGLVLAISLPLYALVIWKVRRSDR